MTTPQIQDMTTVLTPPIGPHLPQSDVRNPYARAHNASAWAVRAWLAMKEAGIAFDERRAPG